jgi:hypothetical protein
MINCYQFVREELFKNVYGLDLDLLLEEAKLLQKEKEEKMKPDMRMNNRLN